MGKVDGRIESISSRGRESGAPPCGIGRHGLALELTFLLVCLGAAGLWLYSYRPDASIGSQTRPVYFFSVIIYAGQGAAMAHYFRRRVSPAQTFGLVFTGLISSVSLYELIFKVSFPLLDPSPGRIGYLLNEDLFPLLLFATGIPAYLVSVKFWLLGRGNRWFQSSVLASTISWLSWWFTCFPLDIQAYERQFMQCPWLHNVITKAAISSLYVTILDWGKPVEGR